MQHSKEKRCASLWIDRATTIVVLLLVVTLSISPSTASFPGDDTDNAVASGASFDNTFPSDISSDNVQQNSVPMSVDREHFRPRHERRLQQFSSTPSTLYPTFSQTPVPSLAPSYRPSSTTAKTPRGGEPTVHSVHLNRPQIPVISTRGPTAPFQQLKFAAVPIGFNISLETQSQQNLEKMAQQAKTILENHITSSFEKGFSEADGIIVRSVDLYVKLFPTGVVGQANRRMMQHLRRFLQQTNKFTLQAKGVAGFQINRTEVDTKAFLQRVNLIIDESLQPQLLMDLFQNSTTGLSDYRVSDAANTENPPGKHQHHPTLVKIIIALILIVLMAAGLIVYACVFWKKYKKRQKRRKQFGVGHKPPSPYKVPPRRTPQGASVTPSAKSPQMATISPIMSTGRSPYPTREMGSSSSESSYKGLGSESEEENTDTFAKELRLAATLDRRAWDDFQQRKQELADDGHIVENLGDVSIYSSGDGASSYREDPAVEVSSRAMEMKGRSSVSPYSVSEAEERPPPGLRVTGDTVSIQSANSFPYGDENDQMDYLPASTFLYNNELKSGILQDRQAESQWNSYMAPGGRTREVRGPEHANSGWRLTEAANAEAQKKPTSRGPLSFLYHSEKKKESDSAPLQHSFESSSDPTSIAVRGSPMSNSWSTNPRTTATSSTEDAVRGSPSKSSWNSASRTLTSSRASPRSGSNAYGSTAAVNDDGDSSQEESESMLTPDIVKEVQKLSQFVKTYEKKKEKRTQRQQADLSYDSTLDTSRDMSRQSSGSKDQYNPLAVTTKIRTSSTLGLTPSHSLDSERRYNKSISRSRSKEDDIHRIESMASSDSSDIRTMESDDFSRRLGITPFSVQKPPGYQNPVTQFSTKSSLLDNSNASYQPSKSRQQNSSLLDINTGREGRQSPRTQLGSSDLKESTHRYSENTSDQSRNRLDSLRHQDAIFDGTAGGGGSLEGRNPIQRRNDPEQPTNGTGLRNPQTITPRKRSKNKGFNSIISMFENKEEKDPIYPPSEGWQYNY